MKRSRKNTRYLILLILLFSITLGYAFVSTNLKINGEANVLKQTWNVYWDSPVVNEESVSLTIPTITQDSGDLANTKIIWTVDLNTPGDFYEFTVDAVNDGTIDAMITEITPTIPTLPNYIKYSITYDDGSIPALNDVLKQKKRNIPTRKKYRIRVYYDENAVTASDVNSIVQGGDAYTFKLNIKYAQATLNYKKYSLGDLIQYDPVGDNLCTSGSTCYKWRVITTDDTKSCDSIELQMDHNITGIMVWISKADYNDNENYGTNGKTDKGPITVLKKLEEVTSSWSDNLKLTYKYDTTLASNNYGVLSCINGVCKINDNQVTTNLKARIITADDITDMTIEAGATSDTIAYSWNLSSSINDWYFFSRSNYRLGTHDILPSGEVSSKQLSWLVHNTTANSYSGATNNSYGSNPGGYWTLSPVSDDITQAWSIGGSSYEPYNGNLGSYYVGNDTSYGLRPVIRVSKSSLTSD